MDRWGGLQLILIGDFFQLPPVRRDTPKVPGDAAAMVYGPGERALFLNRGWAFEARGWRHWGVRRCELRRVFRQSDEHFVGVLNAIRTGVDLTAAQKATLRALPQHLPAREDNIKPTVLFCTNREAEALNQKALADLPDAVHTFEAEDQTHLEVETVERLGRKFGRASAEFQKCLDELEHTLAEAARHFFTQV